MFDPKNKSQGAIAIDEKFKLTTLFLTGVNCGKSWPESDVGPESEWFLHSNPVTCSIITRPTLMPKILLEEEQFEIGSPKIPVAESLRHTQGYLEVSIGFLKWRFVFLMGFSMK